MPTNERTSKNVASRAGQLLNGKALKDAEVWLRQLAAGEETTVEEDLQHSATLIGTLETVRSVAGSALTQR